MALATPSGSLLHFRTTKHARQSSQNSVTFQLHDEDTKPHHASSPKYSQSELELGCMLATMLNNQSLLIEPRVEAAQVVGEGAERHVEYALSYVLRAKEPTWRRFTEFRALHVKLTREFPKYVLPSLPDAKFKLFSRRSLEPSHIEAKRRQLSEFIRAVTRTKGIGNSECILQFLISSNPTKGDHDLERANMKIRRKSAPALNRAAARLSAPGHPPQAPSSPDQHQQQQQRSLVGPQRHEEIMKKLAKRKTSPNTIPMHEQASADWADHPLLSQLTNRKQRVTAPEYASMVEVRADIDSFRSFLLRFEDHDLELHIYDCQIEQSARDKRVHVQGQVCIDGHVAQISVVIDRNTLEGSGWIKPSKWKFSTA